MAIEEMQAIQIVSHTIDFPICVFLPPPHSNVLPRPPFYSEVYWKSSFFYGTCEDVSVIAHVVGGECGHGMVTELAPPLPVAPEVLKVILASLLSLCQLSSHRYTLLWCFVYM